MLFVDKTGEKKLIMSHQEINTSTVTILWKLNNYNMIVINKLKFMNHYILMKILILKYYNIMFSRKKSAEKIIFILKLTVADLY